MSRKITKKAVVKQPSSNQKIRNAERLEVNGIKFRSKLEAFTYSKLLEAGIDDFNYEVDKFVLQEAFEFPNESYEAHERKSKDSPKTNKIYGDVDHSIRSMTYLPDFTNIKQDKTGWILEVKGFASDAFPLKWKLFKKHLLDNNYNVTLYKPNNQGNVLKTIELIKNKYYA